MIRIVLAAATLAAAPVAAAPLDEVAAALAATRTMTADFVQTAPDGRVARGALTLQRPGRIRFDYGKAPLLVVADGRKLSMIDYEVGQVSSWPIGRTPLGPLLDPTADLARYARVVGTTPRGLLVEARDPKRPDLGTLTLSFVRDAAAPGGLALTGWVALDAQRARTEISLANARYNAPVSQSAFSFRDPRVRRTPGKAF